MATPILPIYKAQPLPSEVSPRLYGNKNHQALFSFYVGDIISLMTTGGSALMQWLPSRGVNTWNDPIAHLSWVAPEGFDGSQTYADFKASQDVIDECDFGDGTIYQICEYLHTMERMSWSTRNEPIKQEDLGMKLFEKMPLYTLRGDTEGVAINSDRDWSLARLGILAEEDHNWNIIYGDDIAYPNSYLGINNIITTGWVKGRAKGRGSCDFTDPVIVNGVNLATNTEILRQIKVVAKRIIRRMKQRGYTPSGDDMVVLMNDVMWDYLSQTLAWGVFETFNPPDGIDLTTNTDVIARETARIRTGGLGEGTIRIGNYDIPVITDTRIGASTTVDGSPSITGDIFVLTKRFRGITVLEHQYLKWSLLGNNPNPALDGLKNGEFKPAFFQNGMIRVSVQTMANNNLCWYYGADMYGRIVSYMNMLQGRINDVTVITDSQGENESVSFTSQDFYAFNGEQGGQGDVLLVPLN